MTSWRSATATTRCGKDRDDVPGYHVARRRGPRVGAGAGPGPPRAAAPLRAGRGDPRSAAAAGGWVGDVRPGGGGVGYGVDRGRAGVAGRRPVDPVRCGRGV